MKFIRCIVIVACLCMSMVVRGEDLLTANLSAEQLLPTDSVRLDTDTLKQDRNWWHLLKKRQLDFSDPTVEWPRFFRFCLDVYYWGDRVFNSYDTTYVAGTGLKWKGRLVSDNWTDSYYIYSKEHFPVRMINELYCNAGAYLQFMAVSVGYSFNMSTIIGHKPATHKKFDFEFNCARFNVNLHYWNNTGGTFIRTFGNYNNRKWFKMYFPGSAQRTLNASGYYLFNNKKFSLGAAYSFSRIQLKSAGSAVAGFNYTNTLLSLDFTQLPDPLKPYLTVDPGKHNIHYHSFNFMGGYSYNFVLNKHFMLNLSLFPGLGVTHQYQDSVDAHRHLFSMQINPMTSLTYNSGRYFMGLQTKLYENLYVSDNYSFSSGVFNLQFSGGIRF